MMKQDQWIWCFLEELRLILIPWIIFSRWRDCTTFKKYVGGSPANIAVGVSRHGLKAGFFARVSDDQFGDFVTHFFEKEGIDVSRVRRCEHGEKSG